MEKLMKRLLTILWLSLLLLASAPISMAQSTTLAQRIQVIMDRPEFRRAIFGIEFYSLDAGKPIQTITRHFLRDLRQSGDHRKG
jgi:hypothetical protein